ncbi:tigger transposable element-derived protein 6 [Biomphalaria pfeifferi]|uniref:Tigger transposable element-derived protein 6 n=1 Tax=Biomphalaria pfeifferi TaxID=112525 RepID=A0AAD8AV96_BIOPF|nr:tigger transposable element-derived protein 6 [Biomphalaria pfeifferi]
MSNITPKSGKHGSRKTHEVGAIIAAIEEIKSGSISIRKAAAKFEIPISTLHNKLKGKSTLEASRMLLTNDEESKLVNWLIELSRCGFGKTNDEIRLAARDIMATRNAASKSKNKVPTNNWLYKFYKRHPELSLRPHMSLAKEWKMSNVTPKSGKHGSRKTHEAGASPAKERKMSNITPKSSKHGSRKTHEVYRNTDQNPSLCIPANTVTSLATDISVPPEASSSMVPLESSTPTEASQTEISYNFDTSTFPVIAMTIETPAEASIMSEASDDLWTIPLAIPTQPEASSLLLTPQHRTSTMGLPPQIPSTSKVSSPRKMSTKQLKAHKDLCFFLADEISRHQLVMFFSKLSGSQSQDLSDAKDVAQYQKFLDLSQTLFEACGKSEGQAVTASITADNIFKLPSFKGKRKGNRNPTLTTTVPNLISGDEFREVSKRKHQGIEETENTKIDYGSVNGAAAVGIAGGPERGTSAKNDVFKSRPPYGPFRNATRWANERTWYGP